MQSNPLTENHLQLLMSVYALGFLQLNTESWPEEYQTRIKALRVKAIEADKEIPDSFTLEEFIKIVFDRCGV